MRALLAAYKRATCPSQLGSSCICANMIETGAFSFKGDDATSVIFIDAELDFVLVEGVRLSVLFSTGSFSVFLSDGEESERDLYGSFDPFSGIEDAVVVEELPPSHFRPSGITKK